MDLRGATALGGNGAIIFNASGRLSANRTQFCKAVGTEDFFEGNGSPVPII